MLFNDLSTAHVLEAFTQEMGIRGGQVTHAIDDGSRLFARGVLCKLAEIQPGDQLRGGVAIKATQEGIWLYPYTFRLVCSNGAIQAETRDERPVAEPRLQTTDAVLQAVREAIEACCKEEVFSSAVDAMRRSRGARVGDLILSLLPLISRFPSANYGGLFSVIVVDRYRADGDPSRFGLANAITATARDVQDPDLKWELEKLGGAVAAGKIGSPLEEDRPAAALVTDAAELIQTA